MTIRVEFTRNWRDFLGKDSFLRGIHAAVSKFAQGWMACGVRGEERGLGSPAGR